MKRYDPIEYFDQGGSAYGSMEEKPDGDYVKFDEVERVLETAAAGKTLLDEFAMAALTGLLSREALYSNVAASDAYKYADEMMKDRVR